MLKEKKYVGTSFILIAIILASTFPITSGYVDISDSGFGVIPPYYSEHFKLMNLRFILIFFLVVIFLVTGIMLFFYQRKNLKRLLIIIPLTLLFIMIILELPIYRCATFNGCSSYWNLLGFE